MLLVTIVHAKPWRVRPGDLLRCPVLLVTIVHAKPWRVRPGDLFVPSSRVQCTSHGAGRLLSRGRAASEGHELREGARAAQATRCAGWRCGRRGSRRRGGRRPGPAAQVRGIRVVTRRGRGQRDRARRLPSSCKRVRRVSWILFTRISSLCQLNLRLQTFELRG